MPAGLVTKMMASQQDQKVDSKMNQTKRSFIYSSKMTNIEYSRCDSLVSVEQPAKEVHYKVNLLKQDKIVGGKYLALFDSRANGIIIGLGILIRYFNSDNKRVSIVIIGDYQLTGNRLCTGCSMAKLNIGWIKLIWPQGRQVKTQQNSILSILQMHNHGCLISDNSKQRGGKQIIMTPNGILLPLVIKNGLTYLKHYRPTPKKCKISHKKSS